MSGNLVNAFGKIALDETNRDVRELLNAILIELRVMNVHLEVLSDADINREDVERYGE